MNQCPFFRGVKWTHCDLQVIYAHKQKEYEHNTALLSENEDEDMKAVY